MGVSIKKDLSQDLVEESSDHSEAPGAAAGCKALWLMPDADCLTCSSAFGKIWRNGKRSHNRETKKTDGANTPRDADSLQSASDIPSALKIFRRRCSQAAKGIQTSMRDEQVQKLTDAACRLVEAVLLGIHSHIGKVMGPVDAEIRTLRPGRCASDTPQDLVSICVKFMPNPILGEVATRSRVAVSVRVEQELRFTLQAPPSGLRGQPLLLSVEGLNMPACRRLERGARGTPSRRRARRWRGRSPPRTPCAADRSWPLVPT